MDGGTELALRLLGPLEADLAGSPADLGGPRQRAVLAMLLIARGAVVSVDRLIDDLWHGEPPPRATGGLQVYVSNLRRTLEPNRAPRTPATVLVSAAPGYALRVDEASVDAWRFEQIVRSAADLDAARAVHQLEAALDLWRGDALAEFAAEPWAAPEANRLNELRLVARERLVDSFVRAGRSAEAVLGAEALVREVPLREDGWRLLALGQYLGGRQGDALATLRRARSVLSEELGIDPGPRLAQLEQDILAQVVDLAPAPAGPVDTARVAPPPDASAPSSAPTGQDSGFVGRISERAALLAAADAALPGTPSIAVIAGEAGGGKSALLGQFRAELLNAGWRVAVGRCPEDEGAPPNRPWAEVVRSLAAEVDPERYAIPLTPLLSDDAPADTSDAVMGRFRLHRAVRDWVSTLDDRPLAMVFDDVHRADSETRALLASVLDHGLGNRTLIVLAYRPETGADLDELRAIVARHHPTRIRLGGLDRDEVAELVRSITGGDPDPAVITALADRTDGNPFYLKESARLLVSEGRLVATSQVPEGVGDVLRRRLARLPEESVSVLRLASVIGRDVDVALLVAAAEVDEDHVLEALEAGLISDLLVEPGPGQVRFSHLLVRETLYAGVPNLRRVRWHARVARAVAELYPGDLTALAYHSARAASPATAAEAARNCVAAAELASSRYAYDTEAELYLAAQRCLEMQSPPNVRAQVEVMISRVHAMIRTGATAEATSVRTAAVNAARRIDDVQLLADAICAGAVAALRGTLRSYAWSDEELITLIEQLLARDDIDERRRTRLLATLVRETSSVDDPRCLTAVEQAIDAARRLGEPELLAIALSSATEEFPADIASERREEIRRELLDLCREHELPVYRVIGHILAVNHATWELDIEGARHHTARARELARRWEMRQAVFMADVHEAMITFLTGDVEKAERMFSAAHETQLRRGTVDAGAAWSLVRWTLRFTQGRLGEMIDELRHGYHEVLPAIGHLLALALAETGALAEARQVMDEAPPLLHDYMWLTLTTARAFTAVDVSATDLAPGLYEDLLPYADRIAGTGTNGFILGPVGLALGRLAMLLERPDDARQHFEQARVACQRCGSQVWLDMVELDLAELAQTPVR